MNSPFTRRGLLKAGGSVLSSTILKAAENFHPPAGVMPTRILGKTGVRVSVLALGGGTGAVTDFPSDELAGKFINDCIDCGISYLDTAPLYGGKNDPRSSERRYGKAIGKRRDKIFLNTKTAIRNADEAMRDIEKSLKLLQTDRLDSIQIHSITEKEDLRAFGKPDGVYTLLRKLKDQKVIRFIGITSHGWPAGLKQALEMYEFDTVLAAFNATQNRGPFEEILLPTLLQQKTGIVAMKIMGGTTQYNRVGVTGVPGRLVGDGSGKVSSDMLLRYALSLPIHTATNGIGDYDQLRRNLAIAYNLKPLSDGERSKLRSALHESGRLLAYNKPDYGRS